MKAPLIVISGPSGVGKSTVVHELLADSSLPLRKSVSATTREPRPGEMDGRDYHFWTRERFEAGLQAGEFLEHAIVHGKHYYGTPRSQVEPFRAQGTGIVLVIDVQGFEQVRAKCPDVFSVFLYAPIEELEKRIRLRGSEDKATLERRLQTARMELDRAAEYNVKLLNDDLNQTVLRLREIIVRLFEAQTAGGN